MESRDTSVAADPVTVALAADDSYAMPLATTIKSLTAHFSDPRGLDIYVLGSGISRSNRERIKDSLKPSSNSVRLTFVRPEAGAVSKLPHHPAHFLRLLIPSCLPPDRDKAIYLDSDLLVFANISELWDQDVSDVPLGAVWENPYRLGDRYQYPPELNLPLGAKYFNSGVLLMNLRRWRHERISERCIEFARAYPQFIRYMDQDALNAVVGGNFLELDKSWNEFLLWKPLRRGRERTEDEIRSGPRPKIFHFLSDEKPWLPGCTAPERLWFYEFLDQTAWKGWRPADAAPSETSSRD